MTVVPADTAAPIFTASSASKLKLLPIVEAPRVKSAPLVFVTVALPSFDVFTVRFAAFVVIAPMLLPLPPPVVLRFTFSACTVRPDTVPFVPLPVRFTVLPAPTSVIFPAETLAPVTSTAVAPPFTVPVVASPTLFIVSVFVPSVVVLPVPSYAAPLISSRSYTPFGPAPLTSIIPACAKSPEVLFPTRSLLAVTFERLEPCTLNAPAAPFKPIVVPAVFGCSVTMPFPAFIAPVVFRFTDPAVTVTSLFVAITLKPSLTFTAPAPSVTRVTPPAPLRFPPVTVMEPPFAFVVRLAVSLADTAAAIFIVLLLSSVRMPFPPTPAMFDAFTFKSAPLEFATFALPLFVFRVRFFAASVNGVKDPMSFAPPAPVVLRLTFSADTSPTVFIVPPAPKVAFAFTVLPTGASVRAAPKSTKPAVISTVLAPPFMIPVVV